MNPDTGEMVWHYQYTPHDLWDYDSNMENILFEKDGRKLLGHFDKNGYFFILDRTNGELVSVTPFVDRINWGEIDAEGNVTPSIYPENEGEEVHFYPGPAGGKEWTHACFNPETELFYCPVQDTGSTIARRRREFKEGMPYWGAARHRGLRGHEGVRERLQYLRRGSLAVGNRTSDVCVGAHHGRRPRVRRRTHGVVQRIGCEHRGTFVEVPVWKRPPQQPNDLQR